MCRLNERFHKHHIVPRYMGGTDDVGNLIEISVTQHAMFHFCNYQLWGNEEDKVAWCALSGQITFDDAKIQAVRLGGKKGAESLKEKLKNPDNLKKFKQKCRESYFNSPHLEKMLNNARKNQSKAIEKAKTPKAIEKKKNTFKIIKHQQGEKNSQYGKMWITNGTKEGSYRINKDEPIPNGYWKGRVCFDKNS